MRRDDFTTRAMTALGDPLRRSLYQYVVAQEHPVGREEAAKALGIAHHAAKFHLDRLEDAGLLDTEFRRPPGRRGGPGAGRPAKLYARSRAEFSVSLPPERSDVAALIMARAISESTTQQTPVAEALERAAGQAGEALGGATQASIGRRRSRKALLAAAREVLDGQGFEPRPVDDGLELRNCPYRALAREAPDVVCRMNLAFVAGLLEAVGARHVSARLDPAEGRCCVTVNSR